VIVFKLLSFVGVQNLGGIIFLIDILVVIFRDFESLTEPRQEA
jgi:hypothetical protein